MPCVAKYAHLQELLAGNGLMRLPADLQDFFGLDNPSRTGAYHLKPYHVALRFHSRPPGVPGLFYAGEALCIGPA
ncbi:hypothetical protein [Desulforhabdus amnigena]|uniref:hypothetical protein n=1 Tax=Desulforhabdus amnigena TaxID=40218 RepID=UPI0016972E2B|nr:hypothetical protein [Desulforhabdus amnigena]NLJ27665.1 hypothetical protein [Deltaproteobacteria bacterium]